jgi:cytochrome P450
MKRSWTEMTESSVTFNPFAPGFAEDPYPQYAAMREAEPVHLTPFDSWILFRYEDVLRFLRDPTLSVEDANARPTPLDEIQRSALGDDVEVGGSRAMLNLDAPDHTRLRKLVTKAFTPRVIKNLRPRIEELVGDYLDRAEGEDEVNLITTLAFPLPFAVISEMLGMPQTDSDRLRAWSGLVVRSLEPLTDPELIKRIAEAAQEMSEFVTEIITWKRDNPSDDLLTALIAAEEEGDVLTDDELLDQVMLLYIAGHETTVNLIGNGTLALLHHPDQLGQLRQDPSLVANATEELLRYDSPVHNSRRITLTDVEVGGKTIEAGSFVICALASANRDAARFGQSAGELDLTRPDAHDHLSFGGGVHYCLGAALARLEAQVAFESLVRRFPRMEMSGEPVWNGRLNLRGLDDLPVRPGARD